MKARALELLQEQQVQETVHIATALNLFGIRMGHHVLQKSNPSRGVLKSMLDIGAAFTKDIASLIEKPFMSPWVQEEDINEKADKPRAPSLKQWDADGQANRSQMFVKLGLEVGVQLMCSESEKTFVIKEIDVNDKVVLEDLEAQTAIARDDGAFLNACSETKYKVRGKSQESSNKVVERWATCANPTLSYEWKQLFAVSQAIIALEALAKKEKNDCLGSFLEVVISPGNGGVCDERL